MSHPDAPSAPDAPTGLSRLQRHASEVRPSPERDDWSAMRRAALVGLLSGVPAALTLQVGLLSSLRRRGHGTRAGLPGMPYACSRDFLYLSGTQLQVQSPSMDAKGRTAALFLTVLAPIPLDTLAVRSVHPNFAGLRAYGRNSGSLLRAIVPPQALLGRLAWIPAYNFVYCAGQHQLGEGLAGMAVGSIMASVLCFPMFMVKTNLLLLQEQAQPKASAAAVGATAAARPGPPPGAALSLPKQVLAAMRATFGLDAGMVGLVPALRHAYRGVLPHTVANLGPDCLCMGMARMAYAALYPEDGAFEV